MATITGTAGADTLRGGAGDNHLVGGAGSDTIIAGSGTNEMIGDNTHALGGAAGNDVFVISLKSLQAGAVDVIYDFGGAGGWSAGNNDFIAFTGFSTGTNIVNVVDSTKVPGLAYYTIQDGATHADYTIAIVSTDGKHASIGAGDMFWYS